MSINGFKIRQLRESKNLKQEDLAVMVDTSQQVISHIELNKRHRVSFERIEKIAEALNVKIDDLI